MTNYMDKFPQTKSRKKMLAEQFEEAGGIFRLKPTWVARNSIPPGGRLGLDPKSYTVAERGWISERWFGSTTKADNPISPADEGLSYILLPNQQTISLKEAIELLPVLLIGADYSQTHSGLGRLAKFFDMSDRIAFHYHQQEKDARKVGRNPKEEAYYFPPGVDMGNHPETFFGFHPSFLNPQNHAKILQHLVEWQDDHILQHSRSYQLYPDDGFHVPAGIPHAPGTALTLELQEDSDVYAILQAKAGDSLIPKQLLFKDISQADQQQYGERIILDQIDWRLSCDAYFYEHRHTPPILVEQSIQPGGEEYWIFYNTTKFSGKKLVVKPGAQYISQDAGVYNLFIWQGAGLFDGLEIRAGDFDLEELFIAHDRAVQPITIKNSAPSDLILFKFFGPDIHPDVPMLPLMA